ncbi:MAG: hypothetical protein ACJAYC_001886 [Halieaceae bacterium]|jgi:hypothetical protein
MRACEAKLIAISLGVNGLRLLSKDLRPAGMRVEYGLPSIRAYQ